MSHNELQKSIRKSSYAIRPLVVKIELDESIRFDIFCE